MTIQVQPMGRGVPLYVFNDHQERWLTRLESGQDAQCTGRLKEVQGTAEAFCCLGVASQLFETELHMTREVWAGHGDGDNADVEYIGWRYANTIGAAHRATTLAPPPVMSVLRLYSDNGMCWTRLATPLYGGEFDSRSLVELNDGAMPFEDIATHIRKYPYAYFMPIDVTREDHEAFPYRWPEQWLSCMKANMPFQFNPRWEHD
jgi:hypothetical protein